MFCTYIAEEVKKKWNRLGTYYSKEHKKVKASIKSGAGTINVYISSWVYYDALDAFLKDQIMPRKSLSNLVSMLCPRLTEMSSSFSCNCYKNWKIKQCYCT